MVDEPGRSAAKVFVRQLKLTNYRNYQNFSADFSDRIVIFTGHNGAGKTNLLEALSFLSPGRGLRRAPYNSVIRAGQPSGAGEQIASEDQGSNGLLQAEQKPQ